MVEACMFHLNLHMYLQLYIPRYYTYCVQYTYIQVDLCLEIHLLCIPTVGVNQAGTSHLYYAYHFMLVMCDVLVQWWNTYICTWEVLLYDMYSMYP